MDDATVGEVAESLGVMALRLGIDARARAGVQARFAEIAAEGDSGSQAGRLEMLRGALETLAGASEALTHVALEVATGLSPAEAEPRFVALTEDARARFEHELVRNAQGEITRKPAPPFSPSDEPGVVVVTLVLAHRGLALPEAIASRAEARALLAEGLGTLDEAQLVAFEVIWSPAAEDERVSMDEAQKNYPELVPLEGS